MTEQEWLLIKLSEECAEVIQECTKSLCYGLSHKNPYSEGGATNRDLLNEELNDVIGVLRLLAEYDVIPFEVDEGKVLQKKIKVLKSKEYAKAIGIIDL